MLVVVIAVGVLMSLAFSAGVAADGGTIGTGWGHPHADGYYPGVRIFGCLFGLLLVIGLVGLIAGAFRGHGYHGGPSAYAGPGYWHGPHGRHGRYWREEAWGEDAESMMDAWHKRAHGEDAAAAGTPPAAPATPSAPEARGTSGRKVK
jgi:hypothetical protein